MNKTFKFIIIVLTIISTIISVSTPTCWAVEAQVFDENCITFGVKSGNGNYYFGNRAFRRGYFKAFFFVD